MLAFIGNSLQGVFKMGSVEMSNRCESDCQGSISKKVSVGEMTEIHAFLHGNAKSSKFRGDFIPSKKGMFYKKIQQS